MESWKRAPTRPTRPAWRRDTTEERAATEQPGAAPATPEVLASSPEAAASQPSYAMPERLVRALRRWGEGCAEPHAGARNRGYV